MPAHDRREVGWSVLLEATRKGAARERWTTVSNQDIVEDRGGVDRVRRDVGETDFDVVSAGDACGRNREAVWKCADRIHANRITEPCAPQRQRSGSGERPLCGHWSVVNAHLKFGSVDGTGGRDSVFLGDHVAFLSSDC